MVAIDLGYHEGGMTACTGIINMLKRTINSFPWTWSDLASRGGLVTIGFVVDQSVPAAHDGGSSFAHFVSCFVLSVLVVSISSMLNVELELFSAWFLSPY